MTTDTATQPQFVTLDELVDAAGITKSGYRHLRSIGKAPRGRRVGKRLFFTRDEAQQFLDQRFGL